jgi:hypothetical protein
VVGQPTGPIYRPATAVTSGRNFSPSSLSASYEQALAIMVVCHNALVKLRASLSNGGEAVELWPVGRGGKERAEKERGRERGGETTRWCHEALRARARAYPLGDEVGRRPWRRGRGGGEDDVVFASFWR